MTERIRLETIESLLDALDGYGLVVTDPDEVEAQARRLGYRGTTKADIEARERAERLAYLRNEIMEERISTDELLELQSLAAYIDPGDGLLLQWAGVPEFPEEEAELCVGGCGRKALSGDAWAEDCYPAPQGCAPVEEPYVPDPLELAPCLLCGEPVPQAVLDAYATLEARVEEFGEDTPYHYRLRRIATAARDYVAARKGASNG